MGTELPSQNFMILASYASHMLANHIDGDEEFDNLPHDKRLLLITQESALAQQAMQALAEIDTDYPGLIPVPHDGVTWRDREK